MFERLLSNTATYGSSTIGANIIPALSGIAGNPSTSAVSQIPFRGPIAPPPLLPVHYPDNSAAATTSFNRTSANPELLSYLAKRTPVAPPSFAPAGASGAHRPPPQPEQSIDISSSDDDAH